MNTVWEEIMDANILHFHFKWMTDRHRTRERWDPRRSKRQREVICLWVEILQLTNEPFLFLLLQVIMLRAQENCRESIDVFHLLYLVLKAGRGEPSPTTNLFTSFLLQSLESAVTGTERTPSTRSSDFNTSCFTKTSRDTDAVGISAPGGYKYLDVCLKDRGGALYLGASRFPSNAMISSLFRLDCKANGVEIFFSRNWILLWTEALTQNLISAEALIHAFCWLHGSGPCCPSTQLCSLCERLKSTS